MEVLFAVCSWGLGHAVRDLPLMRRIIKEGHQLTVIGKGRSLQFLKKELKDSCSYTEIPDYSSAYSEKNFSVAKFVGSLPIYIDEIIQEHSRIRKLVKSHPYDRIVSDSRFGVYKRGIPSFFIFHQLRFIPPKRVKFFERFTEGFNYLFKDNFDRFLVPDTKDNSLSGDLSHNLRYFKQGKVEYLGPISDLRRKDFPQDIDYFISLSGPEPQRSVLERKIMDQVLSLKGRIVITLGKPEEEKTEYLSNNIQIFSCLNRKKQEEMMNRAKLIITRSGYTTLMELAFLGKKALFIPTPGQTEQIYLADYHKNKRNFYSVSQNKLNLVKDVEKAKKYKGLSVDFSPKETEDKFMRIVFGQ